MYVFVVLFLSVMCSDIIMAGKPGREFTYKPLKSPYCEQKGEGYCELADQYVSTVMKSVCGYLLQTPESKFQHRNEDSVKPVPFNVKSRMRGQARPMFGLTMVGWERLVNINHQLLRILQENVEGDFMEAGVWKGGSCIVAKAILQYYDTPNKRKVHLVDSFEGLPAPRHGFANKDSNEWSQVRYLKISLESVQASFERYDLLDDQVVFHKGFFNESLSKFRKENPDAKIAFLRMDGDMYESTTDILYNVYDFVSVGGTVTIDDWNLPPAKAAVKDFFKHHGVEMEKIQQINGAVFFIKSKNFEVDYQFYLDNYSQQ